MDYQSVYAQKLTTADAVAALVKDGDWVDYGWCLGTPVAFDAALAKRLPGLYDIKFRGGILCQPVIEHICSAQQQDENQRYDQKRFILIHNTS